MRVTCNNTIDKSLWLDLFKKAVYSSPFQTSIFFDLINSLPNFSSDVFALERENQLIILMLVVNQKEPGIKGFFSRRGIVYGGPLINNATVEELDFFFKEVKAYLKRKIIYLEIRNFFDYSSYSEVFKKQKWSFLPYINLKIPLKNKNLEEVTSPMNYNRRREIRLSLEKGASFADCQSESDLQTLYTILEELYKTKVKLPLPAIDFFKKLWLSEIGKVFIVKHDNAIIGGSFCYVLSNKSIYTMYYCGLRNYDKKIFPTHLAVMGAIDYGIKNNLEYLDFMGAGLKGEEYGVRQYKQEFGGIIDEYGRYRCVLNLPLFRLGNLALTIYRKIKK